MLEILKAILFGIVEGITEWLPVSSTGHLILLNEFIKLDVSEAFYEMFQVVIQLGAILAVIVLFFHKLNPFSPKKDRKQKKKTWTLWFKVVAAVIPSAVLGVLFDDWMEAHLYNQSALISIGNVGVSVATVVVSMALIVYGVAFILVEKKNAGHAPKVKNVNELSYRDAVLIGVFQCLSLVPGTSRSGSTILGGILLGVGRATAAEFSFFLAIPTMAGASALKLLKFIVSGVGITVPEIAILVVGCAVAFLVSLYAIKGLMKYVRSHSFSAFGVYRIALGALVLLYFVAKSFLK